MKRLDFLKKISAGIGLALISNPRDWGKPKQKPMPLVYGGEIELMPSNCEIVEFGPVYINGREYHVLPLEIGLE